MKKNLAELAQTFNENSKTELENTRQNVKSVVNQHEQDLTKQLNQSLTTIKSVTGNLTAQQQSLLEDFNGAMVQILNDNLAEQRSLLQQHQKAMQNMSKGYLPFLERMEQWQVLLLGLAIGMVLMMVSGMIAYIRVLETIIN